MMVPVDALKRLRPHCQETSRLPNRHAALHEPGGGGVLKRMRDHFLDAGSLAGGREALLNVLNRRPVDVQHVAQIGAAPPSTLQVGQKPRRNRLRLGIGLIGDSAPIGKIGWVQEFQYGNVQFPEYSMLSAELGSTVRIE